MDITQFLVNPKMIGFRGLSITYNADAFTPEFLRKAAKAFRQAYVPILEALPDRPSETPNGDQPSEKALAIRSIESFAVKCERQAVDLEADRDVRAALLVGTEDCPVLMEWDLTREGVPVPITEEVLRQMKPQILIDLWDRIKDEADPKSPEIQPTLTSQTISETTNVRSSTPETPTGDGRIM